MTVPAERWLPVLGFEGLYEVSDQGHVRSVERVIEAPGRWGPRTIRIAEKVLSPRPDPQRRLRVQLSRNGIQADRKIHQLVMEAFVGPRQDGMEVCHGNGDSTDNRLTNLRYGTHSENQRDQVRHGTHPHASKTHCKWGHEFTAANTYVQTKGGRGCRACRTAQHRKNIRYFKEVLL